MEIIFALGIATAFNFLIILHKLRKGDIINAMLDFGIACGIVYITSGTLTGMAGGMIASMLVSFYLMFKPIKLFSLLDDEPEEESTDFSTVSFK